LKQHQHVAQSNSLSFCSQQAQEPPEFLCLA